MSEVEKKSWHLGNRGANFGVEVTVGGDIKIRTRDAKGNIYVNDEKITNNNNKVNTVVVTTATHTVDDDDFDIAVTATATMAVTITIPNDQAVTGRTLSISDDGDLAGTNNILIKNEAGSTLFTVDQNGDVYLIRYNGTSWRLR